MITEKNMCLNEPPRKNQEATSSIKKITISLVSEDIKREDIKLRTKVPF